MPGGGFPKGLPVEMLSGDPVASVYNSRVGAYGKALERPFDSRLRDC